MPIVFPDWYKGGFPDAEMTVRDMLRPFLTLCDPQPEVLNWLPEKYEQQLPIVTVFRGSGTVDPEAGIVDRPQVQVSCIARSRADSWALMEFCRQMILAYKNGGRVTHDDGSVSVVKSVCEMVGPELTPAVVFDERITLATFALETSKPLGTPDYQAVRKQLLG